MPALPQIDDLLVHFVCQVLRDVVRSKPQRVEQVPIECRHLLKKSGNLAQVPGKGRAALPETGVILFGVNQLPQHQTGMAPAGDAA